MCFFVNIHLIYDDQYVFFNFCLVKGSTLVLVFKVNESQSFFESFKCGGRNDRTIYPTNFVESGSSQNDRFLRVKRGDT